MFLYARLTRNFAEYHYYDDDDQRHSLLLTNRQRRQQYYDDDDNDNDDEICGNFFNWQFADNADRLPMLADDVRAEADIVADAECDSDCGFRSIQFSWIVFVCRDFCRFCFVFFVLLLFEPFLILEVTPKYPPTINNECMLLPSFVRSSVHSFVCVL